MLEEATKRNKKQQIKIDRLKSINAELRSALLALSNAVDTTVDYLSLSTVCIPARVTNQVDAALARANEESTL